VKFFKTEDKKFKAISGKERGENFLNRTSKKEKNSGRSPTTTCEKNAEHYLRPCT
jgi:hypothetical protein